MSDIAIGFAALGFQGYSQSHARLIINSLKLQDKPVLAFLWNSFGKSKDNLHTWYKKCGKNAITHVYLSNGVDRRKTRKDILSIAYQLDPAQFNAALSKHDPNVLNWIKQEAKELYDFHRKHGQGKLVIALELEHQMTQTALNAYVEAVNSVAPGITTVSNPVHTGPYTGKGKADILELHELPHSNPPKNVKFIASTDGYDILPNFCGHVMNGTIKGGQLRKIIEEFKDAEYFLMWHSQFNGLNVSNTANAPIPSERVSTVTKKCVKQIRKKFLRAVDPIDNDDRKRKISKHGSCPELKDPLDTPGFVWKESEHGGNLVVLFPPEYQEQFKEVHIKVRRTGIWALWRRWDKKDLYFAGMHNPYPWGGNLRQHWRLGERPNKYPENVIVIAIKNDGSRICWLIEEPWERNSVS